MKKGEVKITVIASSFPENYTKKTLFQASQVEGDKEIEKEDKGKIFNSLPEDDKGDDDEWGAVPAFLRRSKLK